MKPVLCIFIALVLSLHAAAQSLAELARREAERRKALKEQGVAGKVIESQNLAETAATGRVTISSRAPPVSGSSSIKNTGNVASFRTRLHSLDLQIRRVEEQLGVLKTRMAEDRWAPPKAGRVGQRSRTGTTQEEYNWKIRELEVKLRQLKGERLEVYERGRKAGFLPGELEGKGITP